MKDRFYFQLEGMPVCLVPGCLKPLSGEQKMWILKRTLTPWYTETTKTCLKSGKAC